MNQIVWPNSSISGGVHVCSESCACALTPPAPGLAYPTCIQASDQPHLPPPPRLSAFASAQCTGEKRMCGPVMLRMPTVCEKLALSTGICVRTYTAWTHSPSNSCGYGTEDLHFSAFSFIIPIAYLSLTRPTPC